MNRDVKNVPLISVPLRTREGLCPVSAFAQTPRSVARTLLLCAGVLALSGCSMVERLKEVGEVPSLSSVDDPSALASPKLVNMPMPPPEPPVNRSTNSLWQQGSRTFFRDQRAGRIGDILTVVIDLDERAELENDTQRQRNNSDQIAVPNVFGFESKLRNFLPDAVDPTSLVDATSTLQNNSQGAVDRSEKIRVRIAATITQVLPNGNLVIAGKQEVVVNYEMRELRVSGVIRPEDISPDNTINSDQIAEARILYGGRGQIHDIQQPRYGSQILDIISPF